MTDRNRRQVLLGTAGLGLAAVACGGPSSPPPAPTPEPESDGFAPGVPPAATGGGTGASGTVLGPATAVPVGGGTVFENLEVVVTQPTAGQFRGFSAVCTHTGCIVNRVAAGTIDCPCHGSRYRLDGSVARGPAPRPLTVRSVRIDGGQIVLE